MAGIESRSLTVLTKSGAITFEESSEQFVEKFIKVTNSSGNTALRSSLSSPSVQVESLSGSIALAVKTAATDLKIKNNSGSIQGSVDYSKEATSTSLFENKSGSLSITLKHWTGFLTAESSSGSKQIRGDGVERWNDGWKKGDRDSVATFTTQSGSINVKAV